MKLQVIHLSDMHFEKKEQIFSINIEKMIDALSITETADECVIVLSGDLAAHGYVQEYRCVSSFLGAVLKEIGSRKYKGKKIEVVCTPGNHDIDFSSREIGFDEIIESYKNQKIDSLMSEYLDKMNAFYNFARYRKCFGDNKLVSKKVIDTGKHKIGFIMVNTAPLSIKGGNSADMGSHFLSENDLNSIEQATEAEINILVMHHSMEWFQSNCKDKLRKIILSKYALVLTGHEHMPVGERRNINGAGDLMVMQGNALYGFAEEGNGFCAVNIDMDNYDIKGYSFIWKNDIYVSTKILNARIRRYLGSSFALKTEFLNEMEFDVYNRIIDDYYVFPDLTYNVVQDDQSVEKFDIEEEEELLDLLEQYKKVVISGEHKAGKTILAKRLYKKYLSEGKTPLYINASNINRKKIEKTIEYAFEEQYVEDNNAYEKYLQISIDNKIILLDDAHLIKGNVFETLLSFLEVNSEKIILFSEENLDLNIRKQVVDAMVERNLLQLRIKPFLYIKRRQLINNILVCGKRNNINSEEKTKKINDMINMQIKNFQLNPEFIINFVNQYEREYRFQFSSGINLFSVVYESDVKSRIIANSENIDASLTINVLRDVAYYMHFNKKALIGINEISEIIENYSNNYRQKVNIRFFLDVAIKAKILVDNGNQIRFADHTLVAYFVALSLNQKYNQGEEIKENLEYLLKNLCFSINSDIILFLALITENPKFIGIVVEGAKAHFSNYEELSFDKGNVKFLLDTPIPVKSSVPTEKEKQQRDRVIDKQEEYAKLEDIIELVNEYDYTEEDLDDFSNQTMISFKYLEILSKALPAFAANLNVNQQDKLVELLYRCPNQFLYALLQDIGDDFEESCNELYEEISALRREKDVADVNIESVKRLVEQISGILITALYQLVAMSCVSEQSIIALDEFAYENNTNYKLQNLMMISRVGDLVAFSTKAKKLDKEAKSKLEKSMIKYTVREYFLRNKVKLYGEAQSLLDYFFPGELGQNIQNEIEKRRIPRKDHT